MRLLCVSIRAPSTPGPTFLHVCLLSFVLSASPDAPSWVSRNRACGKAHVRTFQNV
jgi:hypothetical protein